MEKVGGLSNLNAKIMLRRAYDIDNGIYSEATDQKETFSLIAMHPAEAAANKGKMDELLEKYHIHKIKEYFGCSFIDWIQQPNDVVEKQINNSLRWSQKEVKQDKTTEQLLAEALKNM